MCAGGEDLDFFLKKLPKKLYKYHELHYVYTSNEHFTPTLISSKEQFSVTFNREQLKTTYNHDSYDTLFDDTWNHCEAYGVFADKCNEPIAYLEVSREEWNDRLRITNLLVKEKYRRCGIGSMLIDKAKKIAEKEDRRIITLETQSCNIPAIDFYLHHGFVFSGTNLYFYSNIDIDYDEVMIEMAYLY